MFRRMILEYNYYIFDKNFLFLVFIVIKMIGLILNVVVYFLFSSLKVNLLKFNDKLYGGW